MNSDTTAIIIADGKATRWKKHLGIEKHFAEVGGEKIIERTVRLLKQYEQIDDIYVVASSSDYDIEGSIRYEPVHDPGFYDADKFSCSRELWNGNGRTLVLYGDVYFTDEAMAKIVSRRDHGWILFVFGRAFESNFTGKPYGECFAQSFDSSQIPEHLAGLRRVVDLYSKGVIKRCGGWEHYRTMIGIPDYLMNEHLVGSKFIDINDWTDDFDSPAEYDKFMENRAKHGL